MKKILIFLSGLLLLSLNVFADDVSIDSNGNVKTGVSNANAELEVTGGSAEGAIRGTTSGTGASGVYGVNTTYGDYGILGYYGYGVFGYSSGGYAGYFQGDTLVTGNLTVDGSISGTLSETDPQVGTLTDGKWCTSDGTLVNCNQISPVLTESDPTVNTLGKATLLCASGQVAKWSGSNWICADDGDTDTTYSAGTGLNLSGTTFNVAIPLVLSGSTGGALITAIETGYDGTAVYGYASYSGNITPNVGGKFSAASYNGYGVVGLATNNNGTINYGGYFKASGTSGYGVYSVADNTGEGTNYGGYFEAKGSTGYGVYGSGKAYDFYADGPGVDYGTSSSIRWKRNIEEIDNALDKIMKLRGVYFDWDEEHGGQHDMGFIAEEVGKVIPEVVAYEPDGVYATGVDYGAITPMLVQAIKIQQEQINQLKAEIEELKKRR
jgi:hypothetical protein